jgi:hypothetical protein
MLHLPTYDLETYPNIFTCCAVDWETDREVFFEISEWRDDSAPFMAWLHTLKLARERMIGFNNLFFDYGILHWLLQMFGQYQTVPRPVDIANYATHIITTGDNGVRPWQILIPQIDLFKINHFDNRAKSTSLKQLEFSMQSPSVEDLPYPPGTYLTYAESRVLCDYNRHDVHETKKFAKYCEPAIKFREQLTAKYDRDFMNCNDTKVGKDYLKMQLGDDLCKRADGGPRQTIRFEVRLCDVIFPYITFDHPEFNRVLDYLKQQTLTRKDFDEFNTEPGVEIQTKGVFKGLTATVNGFGFDFGVGGIHGSVAAQTVYADHEYAIVDLDVKAYYPNLAVANQIHPEHLGTQWCVQTKTILTDRDKFPKKTHPVENTLFKLAANGAFGDTNSIYSAFYDPKYTMAITVNGQLLLCKLAEQLMLIPGLSMIQANTDGVTVRCPRTQVDRLDTVCKWWEAFTLLTLERVQYRRMFIRDVNNYIAEGIDGAVKRKGAYEWDYVTVPQWHKNFSALVVPRAVEKHLINGIPLEQLIETHPHDHDFCIMAKCPRSSKLLFDGREQPGRIARYYVATAGGELVKISPPADGCKVGQWKRANKLSDSFYREVLRECQQPHHVGARDSIGAVWDERINTKSKGMYENKTTRFEAGRKVIICNQMHFFSRALLDHSYYLAEARKLIVPT